MIILKDVLHFGLVGHKDYLRMKQKCNQENDLFYYTTVMNIHEKYDIKHRNKKLLFF